MIPRSEYPRPDFQRENWMCLNGEWDFSTDSPVYDKRIIVPYAMETKLSGVYDRGFHRKVYYRRSFTLPISMTGKCVLLHFGAVDYECSVYVNGQNVGSHRGGQSSFVFDITSCLKLENTIEVHVYDDYSDLEMPRGKQYWKREIEDIFYPRTTGIWQSVWLEAVNDRYITNCRITPMFDERSVKFEYTVNDYMSSGEFEAEIFFENKFAGKIRQSVTSKSGEFILKIDEQLLGCWKPFDCFVWSPDNPRLFEVSLRLFENSIECDSVSSYFGMRKVSVDNGKFLLNDRPFYQKLLLDQGYWEESLLTAPNDEAFVTDIKLCKAMGFNGVRKHQKVEDPRFLYYADRMGFLVWEEMASAYIYSPEYAVNMHNEWQEVVKRDYNHPCIVAWTPINEGWGVQQTVENRMQQAHCEALYHITKALDDTRIVNDSDGWMHTCGDLLTIHDYATDAKTLKSHIDSMDTILSTAPEGRHLYAHGYSYANQPVLLTEFGGTKYEKENNEKGSWGYNVCQTAEEFLKKYEDYIMAIYSCRDIQGFCYTQITDVELEQNGLLGYDRSIKIPLEKIKEINDRYPHC